MKNCQLIFVNFLMVVFLLLISHQESFAQTYIDVAPGFSTLNDAITNNTNPNVIYRLQRGDGAIYLLNGSITNTTSLQIEAAAGTGARPQLIPGVGSGGVSDIPFRAKANLILKGVYVTSKDEQGAFLSQIIRNQSDSVKLYFDDCFFENSGQAFIRTDNKLAKIYILNSTVRNCASDYSNGRGIDDRGNDMDTLYVENCTIYNLGSRFLRDGGGVLNYAFFNHNTFTNLGLNLLEFGECPKVIFKNNLVVNCGFIGRIKTGTITLLSLKPLTSSIYQGVTQSVEIHNNNFALDPAMVSLYPDSVMAVPRFDTQTQTAIAASGFDTTNFSELVTFTTPPPSTSSLITAYWNDPAGSSSTTAAGLRITGDYNFAYSTLSTSYSAGTGSQPVGALTWFNMTVDVKNQTKMPNDFSLLQNYPNPFNPTTMIKYSLSKSANVELLVFNSLGQVVKSLVNHYQNAGSYSVSWDGTNLSGKKAASGIYLYRLNTGGFVSVKKMTLLK